jgi:hypothetical protein
MRNTDKDNVQMCNEMQTSRGLRDSTEYVSTGYLLNNFNDKNM